jgi:hypothetical protein
MDFTISIYKNLLKSLQSAGFFFITFDEYLKSQPPEKFVILRHDVDLLPQNSLRFAKIQAELGIKGSYYFRMVPESFNKEIIKLIHSLGHEIGYHYEDMDFAKGDRTKALELFEKHLKELRYLAPINTICMHGSPKSAYDNKDVWQNYNYKDYGIIGEPYFDVDFDELFYVTDTGRMWDGFKVSVRDKVITTKEWPVYHSTNDIIKSIESGLFPQKAMFTMHPQRWHDSFAPWAKELVMQNAKNVVKRVLYVKK